jgi:hypothetical protein
LYEQNLIGSLEKRQGVGPRRRFINTTTFNGCQTTSKQKQTKNQIQRSIRRLMAVIQNKIWNLLAATKAWNSRRTQSVAPETD